MPDSAFKKYEAKAWPYRFDATFHVAVIAGGIPTDPNVAEAWLRKKLGVEHDDLLRAQVAEVMVERGVDADTAAEEVVKNNHLNGFKRDPEHGLYIEGRQLKAAIKEACSVAVASGKLGKRWGETGKGLVNFAAEHVCVVEDRLYLGTHQPSRVVQRFIHTFRGAGIQYEEVVEDVKFTATIKSDWKFTPEEWAILWLTGQEQGIGASRSQGYGRYTVTEWRPA